MKLAVTPNHFDMCPNLLEAEADILIMGNTKFSNRLPYSFTLDEIKDVITLAHSNNKEVYITINIIVHNDLLIDIDHYLNKLKELDIDGLIFSDLSVYELAKKHNLIKYLIYHPETLNTNYYDPIFWEKEGIKSIIISKEITLDNLRIISRESTLPIGYIGHGYLNMFHSRRPLIENFFKYNNEEYQQFINNRNLTLIEQKRQESYPIFQDEHGTHIFREKPMKSFRELQALQTMLDFLIIDGIFLSTDDIVQATKDYHTLLTNNNQQTLNDIDDQYPEHDKGFLYKKTVYDKY
ncbi:MAG: U32 family peptidase [Candidatus Izimaplasma sp.]|nr:U32 family peptidase [Candidatus Izimaplasma bacterium]